MVTKTQAFKEPILSAINQQIESLGELARDIEQSGIPDLKQISELPQLIRQRREQLGLSCSQAAELTGVSATTWRTLEQESGNPRLNTLIEAARTLNIRLWIETP